MLWKKAARRETYLEFPSGTIENEEPEEAALREFFEEAGQTYDVVERVTVFSGHTVEKNIKDCDISPRASSKR